MHITTIATANTHQRLLLAATLVEGYPAPLTDTPTTDPGGTPRAEEHLTLSR